MSSMTARAVTSQPWFEHLTRAGFLCYGVLHLLFAYVIGKIAFGRPAEDGDQSGALQNLAQESFGAALIVVIVIGLTAMALWQLLELLGRRSVRERVMSAGRAAFYAYLAFSGVKVLLGKPSSSADTQQKAAEGLLGSTLGRGVVVLTGLVVLGIGASLVFAGVTKRFERHLKVSAMSAATRRTIGHLGRVGFVAKGGAYGIAGVLFVIAAVTYDPEKARGLDAALRALSDNSYGMWLLAVIAAGFVAYGLFALAEARYRKI